MLLSRMQQREPAFWPAERAPAAADRRLQPCSWSAAMNNPWLPFRGSVVACRHQQNRKYCADIMRHGDHSLAATESPLGGNSSGCKFKHSNADMTVQAG